MTGTNDHDDHDDDHDDDDYESGDESGDDDYSQEKENEEAQKMEDGGEIITLFGIDGGVGRQFVKLALSAGYRVQALSPVPITDLEHEFLTVIVDANHTTVDDEVLEDLLHEATYVVCLLSDSISKKEYPDGLLSKFVERLYPFMKESPVRLFLYQATASTADTNGRAPVFATIYKEYIRWNKNAFLKDQDKITKYIGENTNPDWFQFIVTRPGLTREGPSKKRLAASKSQPGPVPVTNVDLAEFTLSSLRVEKLYNTCPYVVGDGF